MEISDVFLSCVYSERVISRALELHDAFELVYVSKGRARVVISKCEYFIDGGSLVIMSKFEEHEFHPLSEQYCRYYFLISSNMIDRMINDALLLSVFRNRSNEFRHCIVLNEYKENIQDCFQRIVKEYQHPGRYSLDLMTMCVKEILILAYRTYPQNFRVPNIEIKLKIYSIQRYIEENYSEDLEISQIAKMNNLDSCYLAHIFKLHTGFSPKQYLLYVRMFRAREMLLNTSEAVTTVAFKCGFNDVNNFIRTFKKVHNITPMKYKKNAEKMNVYTL